MPMNGSWTVQIQPRRFFANKMNERPCLKQTPSWPQFFLFLLLEHFPPLFTALQNCFIYRIQPDSVFQKFSTEWILYFLSKKFALTWMLTWFSIFLATSFKHMKFKTPWFWPWSIKLKHFLHSSNVFVLWNL